MDSHGQSIESIVVVYCFGIYCFGIFWNVDIELATSPADIPGTDAKLPCDGILVQGSLIVNESMLTGQAWI